MEFYKEMGELGFTKPSIKGDKNTPEELDIAIDIFTRAINSEKWGMPPLSPEDTNITKPLSRQYAANGGEVSNPNDTEAVGLGFQDLLASLLSTVVLGGKAFTPFAAAATTAQLIAKSQGVKGLNTFGFLDTVLGKIEPSKSSELRDPTDLSIDDYTPTSTEIAAGGYGGLETPTPSQTVSQSVEYGGGMDTSASAASGSAASGTAPSSSETDTSGFAADGGQIVKGYQEGDMVVPEQADTELDIAGLGPMGLVDDMGGEQVTGVADDLDMDLPEGTFILNADTVELVGVKDLNKMVKDSIKIAIDAGLDLPKNIDPTDNVPIKISNGEYVIPAVLVPIIGIENLEKMNNRGLTYRKKREQEAAPEQEQEVAEQELPTEEDIIDVST